MRIQAIRHENPVDCTVGLQQDLTLRHVEFERLAAVATDLHDLVGGPERLQDWLEQPPGLVVRLAVDGRLCLLVGELCRAPHHDAVEGVARLAAFLGEHHTNGHGWPVLALTQRAEIVGNPLR
ncbi:hypothetical protein D3C87_1745890 [compost metagenome]